MCYLRVRTTVTYLSGLYTLPALPVRLKNPFWLRAVEIRQLSPAKQFFNRLLHHPENYCSRLRHSDLFDLAVVKSHFHDSPHVLVAHIKRIAIGVDAVQPAEGDFWVRVAAVWAPTISVSPRADPCDQVAGSIGGL